MKLTKKIEYNNGEDDVKNEHYNALGNITRYIQEVEVFDSEEKKDKRKWN
jgi:hypothetical protein